ncbi:spore gernimation protein GerPD [Bacillus sp. NTK071]|uniref:Spore gernimation protein GerPD n=1 Tax=Guptibacillus hwajinpoensis TaxID=208199 RepID=A0A4V5PYZ6_9BACL|nr:MULTISPECIES: spore gernimation protein GerPD [Bacillaceae]MBN8207128.1 spore gernimation protein GerPD [Bacillus sp. NTK071]TKD71988.1 spore gernimation protein GerPD [Pseudalkalibacillus hwajinpoensis]
MNYTVINRGLSVGNITVTAVASSSILLVGDTESIACSSIFDTPPESLIVTRPFVPLSS